MKTDMNPEAVTRRLRLTSELRRLCLTLAKNRVLKTSKDKYTPALARNRPSVDPLR